MPDNVRAMAASVEMRQAQQLNYSVRLLGDIAAEYDATVDAGALLSAACMVEAFFVHIRLLAEFLTRDPKGKDIAPADFGVKWTPPTTQEVQRLGRYWVMASRFVVHLGRDRVPDDLTDLAVFELGGAAFHEMARDVFVVYGLFLSAVGAVTPVWADGARIPNPEREPEGWPDRLLFDRSDLLHRGFGEACSRVGLDGEVLLGR